MDASRAALSAKDVSGGRPDTARETHALPPDSDLFGAILGQDGLHVARCSPGAAREQKRIKCLQLVTCSDL